MATCETNECCTFTKKQALQIKICQIGRARAQFWCRTRRKKASLKTSEWRILLGNGPLGSSTSISGRFLWVGQSFGIQQNQHYCGDSWVLYQSRGAMLSLCIEDAIICIVEMLLVPPTWQQAVLSARIPLWARLKMMVSLGKPGTVYTFMTYLTLKLLYFVYATTITKKDEANCHPFSSNFAAKATLSLPLKQQYWRYNAPRQLRPPKIVGILPC